MLEHCCKRACIVLQPTAKTILKSFYAVYWNYTMPGEISPKQKAWQLLMKYFLDRVPRSSNDGWFARAESWVGLLACLFLHSAPD